MKIGFRSFRPPLLANISLIFALFSASRHLKPFEASNGFIWNHLRPKKNIAFRCFVLWKRCVFVWFRCLWSSQWWFLVSQSSVFYELFELLHLSRDDERKSSWFTVFLCITILCFALLDHKFWSNVSSRIALLAGVSPLPQFLRFSPPESNECIG